MKNAIRIFLLITASFCVRGQSVEYNNTSLPAMINTNGILYGTTGVALGFILGDGTIQNASHISIGSVSVDGIIKNLAQATVGNVSIDGTVKNPQNQILGYVRDSGVVHDAQSRIIGNAVGVNKNWAAVCFFFYKVN